MKKGLDLETLKYIKVHFDLFSDLSTNCMGYKFLCDTIERIETPDETLAEILIENLNEHRT